MSFPVGDWQFWVVTLCFVVAALWLLRGLLPWPGKTRRKAARRSTTRANLTIEGKSPGKGQ